MDEYCSAFEQFFVKFFFVHGRVITFGIAGIRTTPGARSLMNYFPFPMSKDDLHDIAQKDSPEGVEIPPTWRGLISWAVIRFGVGVLFAAVFGIMLKEVYRDMRNDRAELFQAYIQNANAMSNMAQELREQNKSQETQTEAMRQQTEAIKELLRRTEK
jgi:cell division protein FtsB